MRRVLIPAAVVCLLLLAARASLDGPQDSRRKENDPGIHRFELKRINGIPQKLADYKGKVALLVNVASECGFTPQYEGLQKLYEEYSGKGFTVLGFPCNDFGRQEPGTDDQILEFCSATWGVRFPLFSKLAITGAEPAPLYKYLQQESPVKSAVKWNFHKFLVDGEGHVIASFGSKVAPSDPKLVGAIEAALAAAGAGKPAVDSRRASAPSSRKVD